jgi:PST family polysaccharide transporter
MLSILKGSFSWLLISNLATLSSLLVAFFSGDLLTKEEFGAVGLVMLVINIFDSLKELGVKEFLISGDEIKNKEENIAWSIDFIKGFVLFLLICCVALFFDFSDKFYNLNFYLFLLSFTFLFDSLNSPTYYKLRKFMHYKSLVLHNFVSNLSQASVTIFLLFDGFTYEAIIIGYFFKSLVFNITGYLFKGRLPKFEIEVNQVKIIISYGGWLFFSGILYYVTSRLDNLVVAKYLTLSDLGVYTFMYGICSSLISKPSKSISSALFPILSKNKSVDYVHVVVKMSVILMFISLVFSFLIPAILNYLFEDKWGDGYYVVKIFCFAMAINSIKIDSYFMAFKKTKDKFVIELIRASIFLILLIPAVIYRGIDGAAEVTLIANTISLLTWFYFMNRRFNKNRNEN